MSDYRRPAGGNPRSGGRRRRRSSGLIIFLVVLAAILAVGVGVGISYFRDGRDAVIVATALPTAAPAQTAPASDVTSGEADPNHMNATDLALLLSNQGTVAGLSQERMVQVDDLSITPGLNEDWMNILLLGSDARKMDESSRTDTMIICSINTKTGKVKLTSILRDTSVDFDDIGEYSGNYRINAANYFGGPELTMRTVNRCLGMNIQYYVMVDFTSFSVIAERLGGIELTITQEEMEQINKNAIQQAKIAYNAGRDETELEATNVLLEACGANTHLNGRQVLAYARIRKIDSDISRAERQRTVLIALMDKLMGKNAQEIMSTALTLVSYVNTNMSLDQIISIATTVLGSDMGQVQELYLPATGTYVQETREGQSMLYDTDWAANTQQLYAFIYDRER